MDQTQLFIIKQSCLDKAVTLHNSCDSWSTEQILETAEVFVDWVCGEEAGKEILPAITVIPDSDQKWLNFNTPDYNKAIEMIKKGYTIKDVRKQFKVSKKVADELSKL